LFHFVQPIRYYISVARPGLAKASQPLALQRQHPPPEFRVLFDSLGKVLLELLDGIFPADSVSYTERIAKVSVLSSTRAANINIKRFFVDVHDYLVALLIPFSLAWWWTKREFAPD
jgi:hypothetical protein